MKGTAIKRVETKLFTVPLPEVMSDAREWATLTRAAGAAGPYAR